MEHRSVFTFFRKYSFIGILVLLLFLAGCQASPDGAAESSGWFNHYFVGSFSSLIKSVATFFHGNYGLSIVIITLAIRLVIMPFMLKQTKSSLHMQDKMKVLKPEMDEIQQKYKNKKDPESQRKMQQELMQLYQKHNFNPLASLGGCLPMLIQFPFIIGFYYAIRSTPEIATHSFLWFDLGGTDYILIALAVFVYFLQYKVSQIGLDPKMKKQMAIIGLLSPIMIGFVSLNTIAALPLYWTVGGLFMVVQTLISKRIYVAHKRKMELESTSGE
ncbi:membrane protein insertase YidC [Ornithinibacillus contaminans]|uniref:membrane protein insertase YidC n=1 Tax=Ornithinibacillus contaminans TaxID=694055 RepID=UPI00064DB547|nr:membrane protein insertase YidC [Ornithinibacillus contaminans]